MKIVVCIASHDRAKPLGIVLRCMPADWHVVLVLTPGEDPKPYQQRPNTHVFHCPNSPLGAKWQHAVDMARTLAPDLVIINGSDDALIGDTAKLVASMEGVDMLGFMGFFAYHEGEHYWCKYRPHITMPIGGGRVYRRALLDKMRWRLFDTTRDKWLDEFGYANALRHGARVALGDHHEGLEIIALKGDWPQKNPMAKYIRGKNIEVTKMARTKIQPAYAF